jgi:hypothetical protein
MSVFGAVALLLALVHDFWMPDDPHSPTLWPWGAIAFGFYAGIDLVAGGVAEAWDRAKGNG